MGKKKKYDDDDGRVIANMNVDGMPWNRDYSMWFGGAFKPRYRKKIEAEMKNNSQAFDSEELKMTKRETRVLILNAVVAVLLIGIVFAAAAFLFILFCLYVWFD